MLTVLMATRNGEGTLPEVLGAYERLDRPSGGWRLVVVDNGSADGTAEILARYRTSLPLTCLGEPRRGQSRARNAGLLAVEGDLVVFTDDDTVPRADWLVRWRAAADSHPECSVFAGSVLPRWPGEPPRALLEAIRPGPTWALTSRASEGPVDPAEAVGPNFAVRARLFGDGLRFDEDVGPDGTADYAMGSETDLLLRLSARGHRAWFATDAVVEHIVRPCQVDPAWVLRRAARHGRGCVRVRLSRLGPGSGAGALLSFALDALGRRMALLRARLLRDERAATKARWKLCFLAGQALEANRARRGEAALGPFASLFPRSVRRLVRPHPAERPAAGPRDASPLAAGAAALRP